MNHIGSLCLYYKPSSDKTCLDEVQLHRSLSVSQGGNSSCLCGHAGSLPVHCMRSQRVRPGKEGIRRPSGGAADLPALPTFFLKLAQHVHFRRAAGQLEGVKQTILCLRLSERGRPQSFIPLAVSAPLSRAACLKQPG